MMMMMLTGSQDRTLISTQNRQHVKRNKPNLEMGDEERIQNIGLQLRKLESVTTTILHFLLVMQRNRKAELFKYQYASYDVLNYTDIELLSMCTTIPKRLLKVTNQINCNEC